MPIRRFRWGAALVLVLAFSLAGCGQPPEIRRTLKRLRSGTTAERLKAIQSTQTQAEEPVRLELLRMFEDGREPAAIRVSAGVCLGGLHDPRVVPSAIKLLPDAILSLGRHPKPTQIEPFQLGKALAAYGPEALPAVSQLLRDPRKEIVGWVVMHHGAYSQSDQALEVLNRYLGDQDPIYREAAAFGLSSMVHKRAEEIVIRHLGDPDSKVRYNLAWALVMYGSGQSTRAIESQLAAEKDPTVRQELAKALARVKARPPSPPVTPGPRKS